MGVALIAVAAVLLLLCWGSNTVVFIACCHLSDELLYHLQRHWSIAGSSTVCWRNHVSASVQDQLVLPLRRCLWQQ